MRANRMLRGVDILANAVRVTLGPRAATSCSTELRGARAITKDGVTVRRKSSSTTVREYGRPEVARGRAKDQRPGRDGTTTATVLAHAIVREGAKSSPPA